MAWNEVTGRARLALLGQKIDESFYVNRALEAGREVLVLGCAYGQLCFALAARGLSVLGVDPSLAMIQVAEERKSQVSSLGKVRFLTADLRAIRLTERFSTVLAPHNAVGLVSAPDDLAAFFATVNHHLEDDGEVVLDALHPTPLATVVDVDDDESELHAPSTMNPPRPVFVPHLREKSREKRRKTNDSIHRLKLRPLTSASLDQALVQAGLVATERYSGFDAEPYAHGAPFEVLVARRARSL